MSSAAEVIKGTVDDISRSFGNGFRIASVPPHGKIVGELGNLQPGDTCLFKGKWTTHQKWGRQFQASSVEVEIPKDVNGILGYLDRHFKWIGPTVAKRLIEAFGDKLFQVIEHEPQKLTSIQGITSKRASEIHEEYLKIKCDQEHDVFFATHGITMNLRNRLVDEYGSKDRAIAVIRENPYALADDIWGVGFKKADAVALSIGIRKDSPVRTKAGVRWILQESADGEGHCYLSKEELVERCRKVLEVGETFVEQSIQAGLDSGKLIQLGPAIYHSKFFWAEALVADKLRKLASSHHEQMMDGITKDILQEMDSDQRKALHLALSHKVTVVTGGPGVGKTYTVNRIIQALGDRKIELAAPTGKAAKRMSEMSGREARTIHRLLEYNPFEGGFTRHAENPIECDTIIIDETSMLDIHLMASLMDAVSENTQVIFVGDVDQLPSVGPGRILADMIDSEQIPTARLKTLHRQAAKSLINRNAQRINCGEKLDLSIQDGDFWFVSEEDAAKIPDWIIKACNKVPGKFGFGMDDIQVLCPQKKGPVGVEKLNEALRPVLNPDGKKLQGVAFLSGDRVIQMRNNYQLGIFNGDIGKVIDADRAHLHVLFDDLQGQKEVAYPLTSLDELQLAYALTIHKSQGSEFPVVIIPVHTTNYMMLKRNLLYTGITRGKRLVVLVGMMKAVNVAIKTVDSNKRYSNLAKFIREGIS
jgi:exodeoxyribonuclease V alpha subunit